MLEGSVRTNVNGKTVYKNDSLFDPNFVDPKTGKTNLQLMEGGYAPIGYDGKRINVHHIDQTDTGAVMEITTSSHQSNYSDIHVNTGQDVSDINRNSFNTWRKNYWIDRANDFK